MNEKNYPTLRFRRCGNCGNMFLEAPGTLNECPECHSSANVSPQEEDESRLAGE